MQLHQALPSVRPRVLLMDVDDTIAPSTQPVEPPMAAALDALCARGFALAFVSGGSVDQMWGQVTLRLARPHVLLGTSGSHAVDVAVGGPHGTRQEVFNHGFSAQERSEIQAALQALIDRYHVVPDTDAADQLQDRGCQFTLSALGRGAAEARKRAFDPDGSVRRGWAASWSSAWAPGASACGWAGPAASTSPPAGWTRAAECGRPWSARAGPPRTAYFSATGLNTPATTARRRP